MKKSNKILLYGVLVSILYIILCIYIHKDRMISKLESPISDTKVKVDTNLNVHNSKKEEMNSSKSNSTLEYRIENGVITIAGNMPILDNNDILKKTMMRFCGEEYCDRSIVFSNDIKSPSWKNIAKDVIELFYEDNLTNASFVADELGNITISGELLTQKSKDRITQIVKSNRGFHLIDNTHLKVSPPLLENIPRTSDVKHDINNSIDKNIIVADTNIDDIDLAQNRITELLETQRINFVRNRAKITRRGIQTLEKIIAIIKDIPNIKIIVKGYTDAGGKRDINQWISKERAKSVKRYLGTHGINPEDIEAKGFGEDYLLYEDNPYSPLNRRVEIELERK